MRNRYKASNRLEFAIMELAPPHVATYDAPNTWAELVQWAYHASDGDPIPVYSGGCDKTIYSCPEVNHAFRAWHDMLHLFTHSDFSVRGEMVVNRHHQHILYERRNEFYLTHEELYAMNCDVLGQVLYYDRYHEYVDDQAAFVYSCVEQGLHHVVQSGRRY